MVLIKSPLERQLDKIREQGKIVLGVLTYAIDSGKVELLIMRDQNVAEVEAVLAEFNIGVRLTD